MKLLKLKNLYKFVTQRIKIVTNEKICGGGCNFAKHCCLQKK